LYTPFSFKGGCLCDSLVCQKGVFYFSCWDFVPQPDALATSVVEDVFVRYVIITITFA